MNENYRDEARVEHMQRAIKKIRHHLAKVGAGDFVEGNDNAELILYHLVLLGEAANNVSAGYCAAHPVKDMAGLRHKLVHDYANIDLGRIWTILQADFPGWEESVERLAATIEPVKTLPPNVADFDQAHSFRQLARFGFPTETKKDKHHHGRRADVIVVAQLQDYALQTSQQRPTTYREMSSEGSITF